MGFAISKGASIELPPAQEAILETQDFARAKIGTGI